MFLPSAGPNAKVVCMRSRDLCILKDLLDVLLFVCRCLGLMLMLNGPWVALHADGLISKFYSTEQVGDRPESGK